MNMSDPNVLARACADAMWQDDKAAQAIGVTVSDVAPGRATTTFTVTEAMVNGHDICHGGYIFMLADTAFAYSCNSYNQRTVAQHCSIDFMAPAHSGETLIARAEERSRGGRSGIYDISVVTSEGRKIAEFRGLSRTIKGTLVNDPNSEGTPQ